MLILLVKFAIMRTLVLNFIAMFGAAWLKLIYDMGVVYERIICPYKLLDMIYRFASLNLYIVLLIFKSLLKE